jgi:hypothetical protein
MRLWPMSLSDSCQASKVGQFVDFADIGPRLTGWIGLQTAARTVEYYRRPQAAGFADTPAGFLKSLVRTKSAMRGAISDRKREPLNTP